MIDLTNPTKITEANIEEIREQVPCDMRAKLEPGCEVWRRGDPELNTMLRFPDGHGAVCQGADSVWGAWQNGVLIADGDENTWHADNGDAEIVEEHDSGLDAARSYVATGDWGERSETSWVTVRTWREGIDEDGDDVQVDRDSHDIEIEPQVPECVDGQEHDWQSPHEIVGGIKENPGVWGHGGGVTIQEVCIHCGCGKFTDTWAQNRCNGRQGLKSVRYTPGEYAEQVEAIREEDEC